MQNDLMRRLAGEFAGTFLLLAAVVGSGIMGAKLSGGNVAIALLANSLATGAILFVLITALGQVSGAHFNPAVTLVMRLRGAMDTPAALGYAAVQTAGAVAGVIAAHAMFDLTLLQTSSTARTGTGQWFSEFVATFGLILTIVGTVNFATANVASAVALYIVSAYWFTASTSFANPAVTIARTLTDTFAGIAPPDAPPFIVAQIAGALAAAAVAAALLDGSVPEFSDPDEGG